MSPELEDALLKALYAGRRYLLAIESAIDDYEDGHVDTPANADLVPRYFGEWKELSALAEKLHKEQSQ